jgi:hypothetical protein
VLKIALLRPRLATIELLLEVETLEVGMPKVPRLTPELAAVVEAPNPKGIPNPLMIGDPAKMTEEVGVTPGVLTVAPEPVETPLKEGLNSPFTPT